MVAPAALVARRLSGLLTVAASFFHAEILSSATEGRASAFSSFLSPIAAE
jgi:hypothetical protein